MITCSINYFEIWINLEFLHRDKGKVSKSYGKKSFLEACIDNTDCIIQYCQNVFAQLEYLYQLFFSSKIFSPIKGLSSKTESKMKVSIFSLLMVASAAVPRFLTVSSPFDLKKIDIPNTTDFFFSRKDSDHWWPYLVIRSWFLVNLWLLRVSSVISENYYEKCVYLLVNACQIKSLFVKKVYYQK